MFCSFAIVPAAGRGARMGTAKLLLPWGESTVVERLLAAWHGSGVTRTLVVVGPHDRALADLVSTTGADVVTAATRPVDMKASIGIGLAHVRDCYRPVAEDVWLAAPADMPELSAGVIDRLLAAHRPADPRIVVPVHGGRRGHPALFPWPLAAEVAGLAADVGIRGLFSQHRVVELPCSREGIPGDVDTPADYARQRRRLGR